MGAEYDGIEPYRASEKKVIGPDEVDLARVETVEAYRAWLRSDRLHYAIPPERRRSAPRMPRLPSSTDYDHARAFEAL